MPLSAYELVADVEQILALPDVCMQIIARLDEQASAAEMSRIISQDIGLSGRLLKIANSAWYGFPSRVDTISRAVTILGNGALRDLVLTTSVINTFGDMSDDIPDLSRFWRHSIAVAVIAQHLARQASTPVLQDERLFVAGLLHDVGRVVMHLRIPELMRVMLHVSKTEQIPMSDAERLIFDIDHGEVGGELLRIWGLPVSLQEVAAFHHHPEKATAFPLEVSLVHIANNIAKAAGFHSSEAEQDISIDPKAWKTTGLNQTGLTKLIKQVEPQYYAALDAFLPKMARG